VVETVTTREEAIDALDRGHGAVRRLIKQIPAHWLARSGIGGGTWTPKDLLGHLCFWEENVLEALGAWDVGERAPIDREIYARSIGAINAEGVRARSRHTFARVYRDWDNVHGELIRTIRTMSDARWENPATPRGRKSLGHRLGQLLLGRAPFEHAAAHLPDLEAFVAEIPAAERER
jgi:DinB superfamily